MSNTQHLLKVTMAWVSLVYVVCYLGVVLFPGIRSGFMRYALHSNMPMGQNITTWGTFFSGLVIWNLVAVIAVWLFVVLFNNIKR